MLLDALLADATNSAARGRARSAKSAAPCVKRAAET
jgi:hypothetical protein